MTARPDTATVQAWHHVLNGQDLNRFAGLLHEEVEFTGPRGTGQGAAMAREWAERAGVVMSPERWVGRDGDVVVTQAARWCDSDTGTLGEPAAVATHFQIQDGLVPRIARYDTLADALAAAGLDASAEIESPVP